jgi:predicted  nucleic acid-binding Zn-ribbon protein
MVMNALAAWLQRTVRPRNKKKRELREALEELEGRNKKLQDLADKRTRELLRQDRLLHAVNTIASTVIATAHSAISD